jgi:hypothetical protein
MTAWRRTFDNRQMRVSTPEMIQEVSRSSHTLIAIRHIDGICREGTRGLRNNDFLLGMTSAFSTFRTTTRPSSHFYSHIHQYAWGWHQVRATLLSPTPPRVTCSDELKVVSHRRTANVKFSARKVSRGKLVCTAAMQCTLSPIDQVS